MSIKIVIISLILIVMAFGVGLWVGMSFLGSPQTAVQNQTQSQVAPQLIKELSSKVIPSINAYGKVAKIDGRNLTLNSGGDNVSVLMAQDAKLYTFVAIPASGTGKNAKPASSTTEPITFDKIKMGDNTSVNVKVLASGQLQGFSLIVLPPTPVTPAPAK